MKSLNVLFLIIIVLGSSVFILLRENSEIARDYNSGLVVIYEKLPLMRPRIKLKKLNGKFLAENIVSKGVEAKDVEVFFTDNAVLVLPGDSDWLWDKSIWENN